MRPIKFRAWDLKLEFMEDVELINFGVDVTTMNDSGASTHKWEDVVLMQFTGLHDKNGKEIWEGDILKYEQRFGYQTIFSEVIWSERWCGFRTKFPDGSFNGANYPIGMEDETDKWGEVLGNIYENSELLK